ncbi:MAG TPA: hypothetical protein PLH38_06080 [Clostridia bacterium]|nr:hypothetical protein [Clostridia bacterium]
MKSIKQFTKVITIFAAMLVLVAIGALSGRMIFSRSAQQDANMRNLMEQSDKNMKNTVPVVAEGGGELYTIPDEDVSGSGFSVPIRRDAIPLSSGQNNIAGLAKRLFNEGQAFINIEENLNALTALLNKAESETYTLTADNSELSKRFFMDYLGSSNYLVEYKGAELVFFNGDTQLEVEEASMRENGMLAIYSCFQETEEGEQELTEITQIILAQLEHSTRITITSRHTSEGTEVETSIDTF